MSGITIGGKVKISRGLGALAQLPAESIEYGLKYIAKVAPKKSKERITQVGYVKTGKTRDSITGVVKGDKSIIGAKTPQAHLLEYGTQERISIIKPKYKKSLYWKGAHHPVKKVNNRSGRVKAGNFLRGPIDEWGQSGELESIFSRGVQEALERLGGD